MKIFFRLKSILILVALVTFFIPAYTKADEYKWLKTLKHEKMFVYTDFKECDFIKDKLNETIRMILLNSGIKPTISNSLVFQSTDKGEKSIIELITHNLIDNKKIFLYIYGRCIEYGSVYVYQFDVHFAIFNKKYSNALLYSSPQYSVIGADTIRSMKKAFKKIIEDAVADYLSANMSKTK